MTVTCPGCGSPFVPPDKLELPSLDGRSVELVPVAPVLMNADGTAFRALRDGEERHIDMRLRCSKCRFHQR